MRPSPIIILLFIISLLACQRDLKTNITSKQSQSNYALATKLSDLADSFYEAKEYDSAFFNYNKSKELFEIEKDSAFTAYTLIRLARIQQTFGDYNNSEETLTEALDYTKNNPEYLFAIQNLLGIAAKELKNYDDAIAYYQSILKTVKKPLLKITPINNIAKIYIEQKNIPQQYSF